MRISSCHKSPLALVIVLFLMSVVTGSQVLAAETKAKEGGSLHVTSDKMVAEQGSSMVEFIGNVRATRDDAVLLAESVKIFFKSSDPKEKDKKANSKKENNKKEKDKNKEDQDNGQGKVDKIIAQGKVEYTAGERKAFADKAVYTTDDEKLVLTGDNPRMLTGKSWVAGKKITLFRLEERVMVESDGKKRVQAFFDSQDQKQNQKQDPKQEQQQTLQQDQKTANSEKL